MRAHSSPAYPTSDPVPVRRPAPSLHASFRLHRTVTPLRFTCPSAPRLPGQGTLTPEQYDMHGTHAADHLPPPSCIRSVHVEPPRGRGRGCLSRGVATPTRLQNRACGRVGRGRGSIAPFPPAPPERLVSLSISSRSPVGGMPLVQAIVHFAPFPFPLPSPCPPSPREGLSPSPTTTGTP